MTDASAFAKYLKSTKKQAELIKELQTHIKQLQKQLSQIKKGIRISRIKNKIFLFSATEMVLLADRKQHV
jgi:hypothetical protein